MENEISLKWNFLGEYMRGRIIEFYSKFSNDFEISNFINLNYSEISLKVKEIDIFNSCIENVFI